MTETAHLIRKMEALVTTVIIIIVVITVIDEELKPRAARLSLRSHSSCRRKLPRSLTSVQLGAGRSLCCPDPHLPPLPAAPGRQRVACSPSAPGVID